MADQAQILKVLLQVQSDVAGLTQVTAGLKELEAQAAETAAVVGEISGGLPGANAGQLNWQKLADERRAATAAVNAEEIAGAEATAAVQQAKAARTAAQLERQIILTTQLEAAEARIAGDAALAIRLEREADIRLRSLSIQRTLNITTEESIALAGRLVLAEEAQAAPTLLAGANLGKARAEAMVLARELTTGGNVTRTLGSLLGSLGPQLMIAGFAAYELVHFISSQVEATRKLSEEFEKVTNELNNASKEWDKFARNAESFTDNVHLADKIQGELDKMSAEMAVFRATELPLWQQFWDSIITQASHLIDAEAPGVSRFQAKPEDRETKGPFEKAKDKAALDESDRQIDVANAKIDKLNASTDHWADSLAHPKQAWGEITGKLTEAETKLAALNDARHTPGGPPEQRAAAIRAYTDQLSVVEDLRKKQNEIGDVLDKNNKKTGEGAAKNREVTTTLRDQANLLADIRGKQQAISQNPFLSADQKNAQLIPLVTREIAAMNAQLQQDVELQKRTTDPAQWKRLQGSIQQAQREVAKLNIEAKKLTFGGSLRADLTAWVSQFGTTAKQVAGIITNTLNTAIASTSQALTNLIFQTGNWKEAFASAAKSIVQNIIQIVLQWVVSQTLMKLLSKIFATEQVASTSAAGKASASAWAPAATAASIATEGEADILGTAALAIAMAAGKGIVTGVGAFRSGGYTGFGQDSQFAGFVHKNEFVMPSSTVSAYGVPFMESIRSSVSRPGYARGGFVGSQPSGVRSSRGSGDIHIFNFSDPDKLRRAIMASSAGRKIIVDTVNGHRVDLGLQG